MLGQQGRLGAAWLARAAARQAACCPSGCCSVQSCSVQHIHCCCCSRKAAGSNRAPSGSKQRRCCRGVRRSQLLPPRQHTLESVLLPEPFLPMMACTSPSRTAGMDQAMGLFSVAPLPRLPPPPPYHQRRRRRPAGAPRRTIWSNCMVPRCCQRRAFTCERHALEDLLPRGGDFGLQVVHLQQHIAGRCTSHQARRPLHTSCCPLAEGGCGPRRPHTASCRARHDEFAKWAPRWALATQMRRLSWRRRRRMARSATMLRHPSQHHIHPSDDAALLADAGVV